jgi:hypothetical protein
MLVDGAALHWNPSQTAAIAFSNPGAPSMMRNAGRRRPRWMSIEHGPPSLGALAAYVMAGCSILSSPPAAADPLRMKPLTKTEPLTKTGFRISRFFSAPKKSSEDGFRRYALLDEGAAVRAVLIPR